MNKSIAIIGGALTVVAAARITARRGDPWKARVAAAGCTAKTARIGDVHLGYAEGPDNGPPLLLLHAQHMDRHSYSRVLPALVKRFHVFARRLPRPRHDRCTRGISDDGEPDWCRFGGFHRDHDRRARIRDG